MGSRIGLKQTNKRTLNQNVANQWLITEQFSIIDLLLDLDKPGENGRNTYEWNQMIWTSQARMEETPMNEIKSIKQYSKLISIELSGMDDSAYQKGIWHFEDLEYLNTINIQ